MKKIGVVKKELDNVLNSLWKRPKMDYWSTQKISGIRSERLIITENAPDTI